MNTSKTRTEYHDRTTGHECHHGFCCVCGMVWPCSWARRHALLSTPQIPVPRGPA